MWAEWWLLLAAAAAIALAVLALLWCAIEFPGLTSWSVEVHKASPEGRASQERWRNNSRSDSSVMDLKRGRGARRERRQERRAARKVSVDVEVQCGMDEEELAGSFRARVLHSPQSFPARGRGEAMGCRLAPGLGRHSAVSTDDEGDSGVFPNPPAEQAGARVHRLGDSVVVVITPQHRHKEYSVLDTLDLALCSQHTIAQPQDWLRHS
jgi:hypothetical protein